MAQQWNIESVLCPQIRNELKENISEIRESILKLRQELQEMRQRQEAIAKAVEWYSRIVPGPTGVAKRRSPN
jgi:hypothetical protein